THCYTSVLLLFTLGLLGFIYANDQQAFGIATYKEDIALFNDQRVTLWASTKQFKNDRAYYWLTNDDLSPKDFKSLQQYLANEPKISCGKVNYRNDKVWFVICLIGMQKDQLLKKIRHWEVRTAYACK
ncbi:MAG: hypothetical protein AAGJ18_24185, partial [Bacteroidota bacterium]